MRLLVTRWWGAALVEEGRVVARRDFPRDAAAIAERLLRLRRGEVLDEERALAGPGVAVASERLKALGPVRPPTPVPPLEAGDADLELLREATLRVAREETRRRHGERDRYVVQSVRALDDITRTVNTLVERLRDWYALHFPEALRRVPDQAQLARTLAESADRSEVARRLGIEHPEGSIGTEFTPGELGSVRDFARTVSELYEERTRLEALIEAAVREVAPTLAGVVGPLNAARLISHANGLERLATLPSSTVQTLGAETALFQHLKEGTRPPKHGVLFQHPWIHTAPRPHRGRIARALAAAATHAARFDFFTPEKGDRSAPLKVALERRLAQIRARPTARRPPGPARGGRPLGRARPWPARPPGRRRAP